MKKLLVSLISLLIIFIPRIVNAETQALNLQDTVVSIGEEPKFDVNSYKETDKQVIVYLFRSPSCKHCHAAINFLNEYAKENGEKFKLRSYDCQGNTDNANLKTRVANFFDIETPGVPLMVIGSNTFYGFNEDKIDLYKTAIEDEYKKEDKYDVIKEMAKGKKEKSSKTPIVVGIVVCIIVIGGGILIFYKKK